MTDLVNPALLAFTDTETTGTNPYYHEVWEIGIIADGIEHEWAIAPELRRADPMALQICKFYERRREIVFKESREQVASEVAEVLSGRHMVGMVPSFDALFLERFLRNHGQSPAWHYHLVDVEALIAGRLGLVPPWRSKDLTRAIGIEPDDFARHTALGDARWTEAAYHRVMFEPEELELSLEKFRQTAA